MPNRGKKPTRSANAASRSLSVTAFASRITRKPKGIYLRCDSRVNYGQVVRVLAIIRAAGVQNVGLVAEEEGGE